MKLYSVRYVHKISPKESDRGPDVVLSEADLGSRKTLGNAFRKLKLLCSGESISHYRREAGKIVAFPRTGIWWSLILTEKICGTCQGVAANREGTGCWECSQPSAMG